MKRAHNFRDLTGQKFGSLTVIKLLPQKRGRKAVWLCKCKCGGSRETESSNLARAVSCGNHCPYRVVNIRHAMRFHPAYDVWCAMKKRCLNPKDKGWKNYGGRGITVCERWKNSFQAFWKDMGSTWGQGLTLNRKNNNKGYSPENCEWASQKSQCRNTRANRIITTPWGKMCVADAAEKCNLKLGTLHNAA